MAGVVRSLKPGPEHVFIPELSHLLRKSPSQIKCMTNCFNFVSLFLRVKASILTLTEL